jgi:tripartite-type tricarboxylate transporter receptor subunit TctC
MTASRHAAVLLLALSAFAAHAQEPTLTRIVVPYGAGGGIDAIARAYADALRTSLKRNVIVENRPGAGGTLGVASVAKGPADGSALVVGNVVTHVLSASTYRSPPYDQARDFVPLGQLARFDIALAVGPAVPARTLAEYVAWAKADPRRTSYGTAAAGSMPHFFGLLLGRSTGLEMVHVAYKSGPAINADLIGGQLPAAVSAPSDYVQMHKAGRLRMLATSGDKRSRHTPDVPTFAEQGFPDLVGSSWFALFAPSGTPAAELERLTKALREARDDPNVRKVVDGLGVDIPEGSADDFRRLLDTERKRWAGIVKASGFTAEN